MNHPPKQLVLLLSLIGGGVSSYANVRIDEHTVDALQALPGVSCNEAEAAAELPSCNAPRELIWQPQRSALDLGATAGVLVLYGAAAEDWAPGEAPGATTVSWRPARAADSATADALPMVIARARAAPVAEVPRPAVVRKRAGKARQVRVLAKAVTPSTALLTKLDGAAVERIEPLRVTSAAPASAGSLEVERLLNNLSAVLAEGAVARPRSEAGAEKPEAALARRHDDLPRPTEPVRIDRPEIVVETQASKVLRNLGAILSDERDEFGAIATSTPQPVVTTQGGKVMAMLGEIASSQAPAVEDGATRRLRKLAARAAKAQATAAAAQPAVAQALADEREVDVLLPLEPPVVSKVPTDSLTRSPRIALEAAPAAAARALPRVASGPFGDRQIAISEDALGRVRGGFSGDGLQISFGIARAIYINGVLTTTTTVNVSELGQAVAGRGATTFDTGTIALIQNGVGNSVATGSISASSIGTIVQNTLDGQKIQNITVINATANSLGLMRGMNLGSSLRGAVIDSLRR